MKGLLLLGLKSECNHIALTKLQTDRLNQRGLSFLAYKIGHQQLAIDHSSVVIA